MNCIGLKWCHKALWVQNYNKILYGVGFTPKKHRRGRILPFYDEYYVKSWQIYEKSLNEGKMPLWTIMYLIVLICTIHWNRQGYLEFPNGLAFLCICWILGKSWTKCVYTDSLSSKKSNTSMNTMPASFWYFLMMSPVITYFIKLSSIRNREASSCCIFSLSSKLRADWM